MVHNVATTIDSIAAARRRDCATVRRERPEITARFRDPAGNVLGLYQQPSE